MGFIFSDLVLETVIKEGLADLRANLDDRLDVIYDQLKDSYLTDEYGQAELNRFKTYITGNKISITQSWKQIAERLPSINIQVVNGPEDIPRTVINDYAGDIDSYIGGDPEADIESRYEVNSIPIRSAVQVSVHVDEPGGTTALRWLYAAVLYFIVSRKDDLVNRGLDTTTFDSSDFNMLNEFLPKHIYSRYLTFRFTNEFTFTKKTPATIINNIDLSGVEGSTYDPSLGGGVIVESGSDPEQETSSFFTVDEE